MFPFGKGAAPDKENIVLLASAYIRTYKDESGLKDLESLREDLSSLAASKGETIDNWVEHHSDAGSCQAILSLLNRMPFEDSVYVEEVGRLGSTYGEILTALCVAVESGETKASIYRSYHVSPNTFKEFCNAVGWKRRGGYRKAKLKTSETGK